MNIYHHTVGNADQWFVAKGYRVLFQIPRWLGKALRKIGL